MFTEQFREMLQKKDITAYRIAKETGISQGLMSDYNNGIKMPSLQNLVRIANYFDCSVDSLLGRVEKSSSAVNSIEGNVTGVSVVQGSHNGNVTVTNGTHTLTEEETELLRLFQSLDVKRRMKILNFCYSLEEEATTS